MAFSSKSFLNDRMKARSPVVSKKSPCRIVPKEDVVGQRKRSTPHFTSSPNRHFDGDIKKKPTSFPKTPEHHEENSYLDRYKGSPGKVVKRPPVTASPKRVLGEHNFPRDEVKKPRREWEITGESVELKESLSGMPSPAETEKNSEDSQTLFPVIHEVICQKISDTTLLETEISQKKKISLAARDLFGAQEIKISSVVEAETKERVLPAYVNDRNLEDVGMPPNDLTCSPQHSFSESRKIESSNEDCSSQPLELNMIEENEDSDRVCTEKSGERAAVEHSECIADVSRVSYMGRSFFYSILLLFGCFIAVVLVASGSSGVLPKFAQENVLQKKWKNTQIYDHLVLLTAQASSFYSPLPEKVIFDVNVVELQQSVRNGYHATSATVQGIFEYSQLEVHSLLSTIRSCLPSVTYAHNLMLNFYSRLFEVYRSYVPVVMEGTPKVVLSLLSSAEYLLSSVEHLLPSAEHLLRSAENLLSSVKRHFSSAELLVAENLWSSVKHILSSAEHLFPSVLSSTENVWSSAMHHLASAEQFLFKALVEEYLDLSTAEAPATNTRTQLYTSNGTSQMREIAEEWESCLSKYFEFPEMIVNNVVPEEPAISASPVPETGAPEVEMDAPEVEMNTPEVEMHEVQMDAPEMQPEVSEAVQMDVGKYAPEGVDAPDARIYTPEVRMDTPEVRRMDNIEVEMDTPEVKVDAPVVFDDYDIAEGVGRPLSGENIIEEVTEEPVDTAMSFAGLRLYAASTFVIGALVVVLQNAGIQLPKNKMVKKLQQHQHQHRQHQQQQQALSTPPEKKQLMEVETTPPTTATREEVMIITPQLTAHSSSPYGSFTALKRFVVNEGSDNEEVKLTPVRRSNRIRNRVMTEH